jgi:hypothetical protein
LVDQENLNNLEINKEFKRKKNLASKNCLARIKIPLFNEQATNGVIYLFHGQ